MADLGSRRGILPSPLIRPATFAELYPYLNPLNKCIQFSIGASLSPRRGQKLKAPFAHLLKASMGLACLSAPCLFLHLCLSPMSSSFSLARVSLKQISQSRTSSLRSLHSSSCAFASLPTKTSSSSRQVAEPHTPPHIPTNQAPNVSSTWSADQNPRNNAMKGPRFEQMNVELQPQPLSAMEMISREPIRLVNARKAECDGGE